MLIFTKTKSEQIIEMLFAPVEDDIYCDSLTGKELKNEYKLYSINILKRIDYVMSLVEEFKEERERDPYKKYSYSIKKGLNKLDRSYYFVLKQSLKILIDIFERIVEIFEKLEKNKNELNGIVLMSISNILRTNFSIELESVLSKMENMGVFYNFRITPYTKDESGKIQFIIKKIYE